MRFVAFAVAAVAAVSFSSARCHADSTVALGSDSSAQNPGVASDLPGRDLCDLQVTLTRPSSSSITAHDPLEAGALGKVLRDPSLLAAAPGSPAAASTREAVRPKAGAAGSLPGASSGGAAPATAAGSLPNGAPVAGPSQPASGSSRSLNGTGAPVTLMSAATGDPSQDWSKTPSGLLSSPRVVPVGAGSNPPAATGSGPLTDNGGLFTTRVAAANAVRNGAPGAGQPGVDDPGPLPGPVALPPALVRLLAPPRRKPVGISERLSPYALAFLGLAVAPLAAAFLRRRLA